MQPSPVVPLASPTMAITRTRLLRLLQSGLTTGHVLINAGAGAGKSTLLRQLAAQRPHTWYLPLSLADLDFTVWRERISEYLRTEATLLLDDVHLIETSQEVCRWLTEQLAQPAPRLVLAGRHLPTLDLTRPIAQGAITQLNNGHLAFSAEECRLLLGERHAQQGVQTLEAWRQRLAGWALGMGLLAQLPETHDPLSLAESQLFHYLATHSLRELPGELQRFLLITAVPLRFNDALAGTLLNNVAEATRLRHVVEQRSFFLESTGNRGWFRYHDLIRDFLLQQAGDDALIYVDKVVDWFQQQGDLEQAIEQALASSLPTKALDLLRQLPANFLRDHCRYLTYRRWLLSLPETLRQTEPSLLVELGANLFSVRGYEQEAWSHLQQAVELSAASADWSTNLMARTRIGLLLYKQGEYDQALTVIQAVLADERCQGAIRLRALRLASVSLSEMARFHEARSVFSEAITLAETTGDLDELFFNRNNLALTVLIPLGEFSTAAQHLQAELRHFAGSPGLRLRSLTAWCDLCTVRGDWPALAQAIDEAEQLHAQMEVVEAGDQLWLHFYRAVLATGQGRLVVAHAAIAQAHSLARQSPLVNISLAWVESWRLRRAGETLAALALIDATLAQLARIPFWRASMALDRAITQWTAVLLPTSDFVLHPEAKQLIQWRARSELVRLRALLAVVNWRCANGRWQRHAQAVLASLRRPDFARLLIDRDPDLGRHFWSLLLIEDVASEQAKGALQAIGESEPLLPLLAHNRPAPRRHAAAVLAAIGHETAMPALNAALSGEKDQRVAEEMENALACLEEQPPPALTIKLMGGFALQRGDQLIAPSAWPRPIVLRLFQYFALQRGVALARDRILEDLWPESDPESAWSTFRTVYSRVRQVLEPYMRPKAPSRYFSLEGEAYRFDPRQVASVDSEQFERRIQHFLQDAHRQDVPPLPADLLTTLSEWAPLLPDLPYADWLTPIRERLHETYVAGALYAAQSLLIHRRLPEAVVWAQRTITAAPWHEEGYQVLMRAYGQQGQRPQALKVYSETAAALRRELDVEPSPLTHWLAERLRRGEEI